ncbi:hypothetical protein LH92_10470 [Acinetobacter baumannii]|uniref:hypothetical protein n=1 Tax=Acinetobacter baumannii TaxID=470 RepID=UPI00051460CC|nr:hypothetical protein [Acinetobacter baumannii]KGF60295.1 hypothetical protein LH92_10470 [Acinetobacter baumannii]
MICIYCNSEVNGSLKTNEHVIPQWIIKKLDIKNKKLSFLLVSRNLKKINLRTPVPHTLTHKICNTCNNDWLSKIDNSCKKGLELAIDGIDNNYFWDLENARNLFIFIYKIFLNFFATSEEFKKEKIPFYNEFYKNKFPPDDVSMFISKIHTTESFSITHLDHWLLDYENQLNMNNINGFRFKFFIQLGKVAFVLCSSGESDKQIVYDPRYLHPFIISKNLSTSLMGFTHECQQPVSNTISNRILFNLIRVIN